MNERPNRTSVPGVRVDALRKVWPDGSVALDDVTLDVPGGQFVAILGRSGSGKSTLLRCASRLVEPTAGQCSVGGTELTGLHGRALARARGHIGFVFQQFNLVRSYTAMDNVLVARIAHVSYARGLLGLWTPHDRDIARTSLAAVGMEDKSNALVRELSGGQQQRVAIARAFAQVPSALFADEPTASLDPQLAVTVMDLLHTYGREHNVPVVVNVHTIEHARRFADRVVGLRAGRIVHDGPARELTDNVVADIYGAPA